MKPMSNNESQKKRMEKLKSNGEYERTTRKKELNKEDFQEKKLRI